MKKARISIFLVGVFSIACQLFPRALPVVPTPTRIVVEPVRIDIANATMIYYELNGSTPDELRAQLNQLGPVDPLDGLHYDARTDWHISWTWPGYGESECDLSRATISYNTKVTVPYWQPAKNTDPALIEKWNRYLNNLALHEQGHVNYVATNYLQVKDAIQNATCLTAEQAAQDLLTVFRQADAEYDEQTKHGETQGAVFP
jgi:predicted secreted Zn-dependent protease